MKASFGTNQRWIVAPEFTAPLRAMFLEVFGATISFEKPELTIYTLSDGGNVGIFVEPERLSPEDARLGAWLEFHVPDVEDTAKKLASVGVKRVEFRDKDHLYFQAPGGPVFRLARG